MGKALNGKPSAKGAHKDVKVLEPLKPMGRNMAQGVMDQL
jgi:hypothetical protein